MSDISIDLHLHFDGSLSLENARELAAMQNISIPTDRELKELLTVGEDCRNLGEYLEKFDFPLSLLQTEDAIEQGMYSLCRELWTEGCIYAEIRFAPQLHMQKGLSQEQVVKAAIKGFKASKLLGGLILCCMRGNNNGEQNFATVTVAKDYLHRGVLALDLAGNEFGFPTENFSGLFEQAREQGIPFTVHAGEAAGADSIKQALKMGASRIGHGVRALEEGELVARLAAEKIPLELCPTSNLNTAIFKDIRQYPLRALMDAGVIVTLNSDNRSVSDTTAKKEMQLMCDTFGLTESEEKRLLRNSVYAAFCDSKLKSELLKMI